MVVDGHKPWLGVQAHGFSDAPRVAHSVASSVYAVITAVISHLITHGSTDPLREYALNSTAVIYLLNNTYSVIRHKYARTATRDYT